MPKKVETAQTGRTQPRSQEGAARSAIAVATGHVWTPPRGPESRPPAEHAASWDETGQWPWEL